MVKVDNGNTLLTLLCEIAQAPELSGVRSFLVDGILNISLNTSTKKATLAVAIRKLVCR
jgi:hypothetical protein